MKDQLETPLYYIDVNNILFEERKNRIPLKYYLEPKGRQVHAEIFKALFFYY